MRFSNVAALVVATAFAFACTDRPAATATGPGASLRLTTLTGGPCNQTDDNTIRAQQVALFSAEALTTAKSRWERVEAACSPTNPDAANAALLFYVQFTLSAYPNNILTPNTGTKEDALQDHWNTIFPWVGYPAPNLPTGTNGPFGPEGALGVISRTGGDREIAAANAALRLAEQSLAGDRRWHLFAIYPLSTGCLTATNLAQGGPCFEFAAFPAVNPVWNPLIKVGVCQPLHANDPLPGNIPALGHLLANGKTEIAGSLHYPLFCQDLADANTGSWTGGFGSVMTRLAWMGRRALNPNVAYAGHGGLGGLGGGISPFSLVDLMVFHATFSTPPNVIGQQPTTPEVGTFQPITATAPGSILVQNSLGQYTGPLAVLMQAGGNCANCGGLLLQGNLFSASGSPAADGVYQATWTSLQDKPSLKEAPFILRDDNVPAREIARLSYKTISSKNRLYYNGVAIAGVTWTQHAPQNFKIQVDLNTKKTSLWIGSTQYRSNVAFYNTSAANFAQIAADFTGIDSGTMGWDEVTVVRLADH